MVSISTIATFDAVVGSIAALGLAYLVVSKTIVVHYRRFFQLITVGLFGYAATGLFIGRYAPEFIHAVHALAAVFICLGLVDLLRTDVRRDEDFAQLFDAAFETGPSAE